MTSAMDSGFTSLLNLIRELGAFELHALSRQVLLESVGLCVRTVCRIERIG